MEDITVSELKSRMDAGEDLIKIDSTRPTQRRYAPIARMERQRNHCALQIWRQKRYCQTVDVAKWFFRAKKPLGRDVGLAGCLRTNLIA